MREEFRIPAGNTTFNYYNFVVAKPLVNMKTWRYSTQIYYTYTQQIYFANTNKLEAIGKTNLRR